MAHKTPQKITVRAQAEALNLSTRRISALRAEGMPHDLNGSKAWVKARQSDSAERLREARIAVCVQQERLHKLAADERAGLLVERSQVDADAIQTSFMLKRGMLDLQNALPGELVGLSEVPMSLRIRHHVYRIMQGLYDGKYSAPPEAREVIESMNPNKKSK